AMSAGMELDNGNAVGGVTAIGGGPAVSFGTDTAVGSTIGLEIGIGIGLAASDGIDVAVGNGVGGATERAGRSTGSFAIGAGADCTVGGTTVAANGGGATAPPVEPDGGDASRTEGAGAATWFGSAAARGAGVAR